MKACKTAQKHAKPRKTSQNSAKIRKSIKVFKCLVLPFQFFLFAVQKSVAQLTVVKNIAKFKVTSSIPLVLLH